MLINQITRISKSPLPLVWVLISPNTNSREYPTKAVGNILIFIFVVIMINKKTIKILFAAAPLPPNERKSINRNKISISYELKLFLMSLYQKNTKDLQG